jgi:hypothetical protein
LTTHLVIPDTQVKPGVPTDHLRWLGHYILQRRPDVIVHLGDHWDMPSLSAWDKGKLQMEGRRYRADILAGNRGLALLDAPTLQFNRRRRHVGRQYHPRKVLLLGNHENRIQRAVEENPHLEGAIGYGDLETRDWEVHDYLQPVWIDGIAYCHVFTNPLTGRPHGGLISTRLKTLGHSFTMGHQQTLDSALRFVHGKNGPTMQRGLVAGAAYLHDEEYKSYQGNAHWRGVIVKHEVDDGSYDLMEVSLDFLCRKYEKLPLGVFLRNRYPNMRGSLWAD